MRRFLTYFVLILAVFTLGYYLASTSYESTPPPAADPQDISHASGSHVDFSSQVEPILNNRCLVCHGCYDAPCQLKLSSADGMARGASKELVYNPARLKPMQPTRLFIDAKTPPQWRQRDFHAVLNESENKDSPANASENLQNSLLYQMLRLKQQNPLPEDKYLSDDFSLSLAREQSCPSIGQFNAYASEHPLWGMPYATPGLQPKEHQTLVDWIAQGANRPLPEPASAEVARQIKRWEAFFNRQSNKQRLVSRYLYEHLYHAHIHFKGSGAREFYRLVRSTTPPAEKINEIATIRPFDDPGVPRFYYRLLKYTPTIVVKNHIVYEFSAARMARFEQLFLTPDYQVDALPGYQTDIAANPFKVFAAIPTRSRYQFLLDEARFFIEGFIKGPVCRGQIALNVIEDQFWVMFFDPERSVITNDDQFIGQVADELQVPLESSSNLDLVKIWTDYWDNQRNYMLSKQSWFETIGTHDINHALSYIWDGEATNPNAALTVFRHFDSGSVSYGLIGDMPETAWVIDYPLFERIHYLLVANFNVFGNIGHQLSTRIYMDFLRMEGEDQFLVFLPVKQRKAIRDAWHAGLRSNSKVEKYFTAPQDWLNVESVNGYQRGKYRSMAPQQELYTRLEEKFSPLKPASLSLNRCGRVGCDPTLLSDAKVNRIPQDKDALLNNDAIESAMQTLSQIKGVTLDAFPDVSFIRVEMPSPQTHRAYTLIRNKAYKNVTSFFADTSERERADLEQDSVTVVNWLEGSYPNFFFSVSAAELEQFTRMCAAIKNRQDYEDFVDRFGVRRTDQRFWELADWFQQQLAETKPVSAGLFDLNRYKNR